MRFRSVILVALFALAVNLLFAVHVTGDLKIRVVDRRSGLGIPHVRVTTDTGSQCYTDKNGIVRWNEPQFIGRVVSFKVYKDGFQAGADVALQLKPFGSSVLKLSSTAQRP